MIDALLLGLSHIIQWPALGYVLGGVLLGIYFGAIPGLGGLTALALVIPFTFGLEPTVAIAFLLAMYAVIVTGDTLSSVLLGVPGTVASQATVVDGHPLAQKGEAARALGAAFMASAIGGIIGAIALALTVPVVRPFILSFSRPEFFMLGLVALTMVGGLSGKSMLKGVLSACFGLLLSMIGYSTAGVIPRYWFGQNYLLEGLPLVPFLMGFFGLPELIDLAARRTSVARASDAVKSVSRVTDGIKDAFRHWWLVIRCSVIGVYIGMLPGIGGSVSDWIAYGHAVQSAKDRSKFGNGDIRGVIAPESANNATSGGNLVPTIAFAIPGSAGMAVMLGAFTIHGIEPGPSLLTTRLDVTFSMVWTLVLANVIATTILLLWGRQISRIIFIPGVLFVPAVLVFMLMGSWLTTGGLGDWITFLCAGVLGFVMRWGGWSRPPVVLGVVLGASMENSLALSTRIYGLSWIGRPIVIALGLVILFVVAQYAYRAYREARSPNKGEDAGRTADIASSENAYVSLGLAVAALVAFCLAGLDARTFEASARLFPLTAIFPGILLSLLVIRQDLIPFRDSARRQALAWSREERAIFMVGCSFLVLLGLAIALVPVLDQRVVMALMIFLFLVIWAKRTIRFSTIYTAVLAAVIYVIFEHIVPIVWHKGAIFDLLS